MQQFSACGMLVHEIHLYVLFNKKIAVHVGSKMAIFVPAYDNNLVTFFVELIIMRYLTQGDGLLKSGLETASNLSLSLFSLSPLGRSLAALLCAL